MNASATPPTPDRTVRVVDGLEEPLGGGFGQQAEDRPVQAGMDQADPW